MPPNPEAADEDMIFLDEQVEDARPGASVWRVLIVDDDVDVHSATTFALSNLQVQGRPLHFLHAFSAVQARQMVVTEPDIAVILLDVVMEQEDSGLQLVRHVRHELAMKEVRIILRTGQPGYAPEMEAIRDFDINDYRTKSELTRIKLFTSLTAAIRSYEQIRTVNASRRGLEMILQASTELMQRHDREDFAAGALTQIASLLGVAPQGVLCVQEPGTGGRAQLRVLAAAGAFRALHRRTACDLPDAAVSAALSQGLQQRANIYGRGYTVLYFAGNASLDFVAYMQTAAPLDETDRRMLEVFCSNITVGLDNLVLVGRLHSCAFYDPLTTLPNRARLAEILNAMLDNAERQDTTLALVDIDHFSETNDALGHLFGDMLLLAVTRRLQTELGAELRVARAGGDIFAVLGSSAQVHPTPILALFERPFEIDGQTLQLSSTLGLVRLQDYQGSGIDALRDVDIALKRAKLMHRTSFSYFSRNMGVDIRERVRMMHALRAAHEARELSVVYQPQIDLATRRAVGAEALLRWRTADGNFIPPDHFIPIAEYSGIIIELGGWILREAGTELVRLRALGHVDFTMSVNVSQAQFRHPRFLEMLRTALADSGAPPHYIELEITESMAMEEPAMLIRLLDQIKQTGVSIAIDDFGTGFSSLNHLQKLHVDKLKIDRAFVSEITGSTRGSRIAQMVIQLGRNLGLGIIAEGVEDEQQAQILLTLGCPVAQGFLFARPMSGQLLTEWLQSKVS